MLKSQESNIRSFVKFINTTERDVEVCWINFKGEQISYSTLTPGNHCSINTFVTHPWIFQDAQTGERFEVDRKFVFFPEPWFKFISNATNGVVSVARQEIFIRFPLRTLKTLCLWEILLLLNSPINDIDDLEIPKSLRIELSHVLENSKFNHRNNEENDNEDDEDLDFNNDDDHD